MTGQKAAMRASHSSGALAMVRTCAHTARHAHTLGIQSAAARILEALLVYGGWPGGALVALSPAARLERAQSVRILAADGLGEPELTQRLHAAYFTTGALLANDQPAGTSWLFYALAPANGGAIWQPRLAVVLLLSSSTTGQAEDGEAIAALDLVAESVVLGLEAALADERSREMEASSRADEETTKNELISSVGHELRSPLTAIKGYAETLLRHEQRLSRAERHQFLQAIEEASARLALVIDRMLEVSELAGEGVRLEYAAVQLSQIAREAFGAAEARLHSTGNPMPMLRLLASEATLDALPDVWGDARRLREVLDHVLENAIQYSPDGGYVDVLLRRASAETVDAARQAGWLPMVDIEDSASARPAMLEIQVRDAGIGIPPEHLKRIFERFHRVDTRLTRTVNGLGVGLAISKRLIELHSGAIWAESEIGRGSTFFLLLPIAAAP